MDKKVREILMEINLIKLSHVTSQQHDRRECTRLYVVVEPYIQLKREDKKS